MIKIILSLKSAIKRARVWGIKGVMGFAFRTWRERKIRAFLIKNAKRFSSAPTERGITIIAPLSGCYSLSKTVRDFAFALKEVGIPFQTFDIFTERKHAAKSDYADVLTPIGDFQINRYTHIIEMFKSPLPDDILPWAKGNHRARIAFWEGPSGMIDVFPYLANGNAVIAMSDFNYVHFLRELSGKSPVHKILYPLMMPSTKIPSRDEMRKRYSINSDSFVVFFNFDLGSAFRKNGDGAMRAFAEAFVETKDACLVYKINGCNDHQDKLAELKSLAKKLAIADRFITIESYIPQEELFGLTAAADVYLSLHRAEGFGLGISEAMCFGIPVVVTDYSSTTEFCHAGSSMPIPYKLVPVEGKEYFANMGEWADPDEHAAAKALRALYDDPKLRVEIGSAGNAFIESHFAPEAFKRSVDQFLNA